MRNNKLIKAQLEVRRIKMNLDNSYQYREVTPTRQTGYTVAIFTVIMTLIMILGVFASLYFFI